MFSNKADTLFYPLYLIDRELDKVFAKIKEKNMLKETNKEKAFDNLAYVMTELNLHGAVRKCNRYTEKKLEKACQTVILFINSNVPGQIEEIKTISQERNVADGGK